MVRFFFMVCMLQLKGFPCAMAGGGTVPLEEGGKSTPRAKFQMMDEESLFLGPSTEKWTGELAEEKVRDLHRWPAVEDQQVGDEPAAEPVDIDPVWDIV